MIRAIVLILALVLALATAALAEEITITISPAAKADLAIIANYEGKSPEAWLAERTEASIQRHKRIVRAQIIEALKVRISDPLTTEQLMQAWDTGRIPTPYPTNTPVPTNTPAPTFTPTNTATPTVTPVPPTPTRTPPGHSGGK